MADHPENSRGTDHSQTRSRIQEETANDINTPQPPSQPQSQSQQPSLANRIQSSAAGLARSAFQGGAGDIGQTLSGLSDGKSGGSAPGTATARAGGQGYLASRETYTGPPGLGSAGYARQAGAESFREGGTGSTHPAGGFALPEMTAEEFQRGEAYTDPGRRAMMSGAAIGAEGVHTSSRTSLDDLQGSTGSWKGKARAHDPVQLEYNTAWERAERVPVHAESTQDVPTDGAAVVSLLSDASFDPNFDPSTEEIDLDPSTSPPPLTASEIETLESFRRQMGSSETGVSGSSQPKPQQQLSGQSLIPDIDTFLQQNDPAYTQQPTDPNSAMSLRDNVLANLPGAAEWVTVQERYHDEVWGYLRPALEAAKAEMEENRGGGEGHGEDGPAVRRLKMILKHMKA